MLAYRLGEMDGFADACLPSFLPPSIYTHATTVLQWLIVIRTPELAVVRVGVCLIVALVLGSLFWQSNTDAEGLSQRTSYFAYGEQSRLTKDDKFVLFGMRIPVTFGVIS